jgi:hypothetical protein
MGISRFVAGKVYVGLNVCTGDLLAVKQIDFDNITREEARG